MRCIKFVGYTQLEQRFINFCRSVTLIIFATLNEKGTPAYVHKLSRYGVECPTNTLSSHNFFSIKVREKDPIHKSKS